MKLLCLFIVLSYGCSDADWVICANAVAVCGKLCACSLEDCLCCPQCASCIVVASATCCECIFPNWEDCNDNTNLCQNKPNSDICCNGHTYDNDTQICCGNKLYTNDYGCCNDTPYNTRWEMCCGGKIYEEHDYSVCCGGQIHETLDKICCEEQIVYPAECCAIGDFFNPSNYVVCPIGNCCQLNIHTSDTVCCAQTCNIHNWCE